MITAASKVEDLATEAGDRFGDEWVKDVLNSVSESDFGQNEHGEWWVELIDRRPGDLEDHPHLVYCNRSSEPDAVTRRDYRPL